MSSFNKTTSLLVMTCVVFGCRPKPQAFSYDKSVNLAFIEPARAAAGETSRINYVNVYRAVLREQLVERDGVAEYKLINDSSRTTERLDLPGSDSRHELFLFEIVPHRDSTVTKQPRTVVLYLATSFMGETKVIGMRPAYGGVLNNSGKAEFIKFTTAFKVKKKREKHLTDAEALLPDSVKKQLYYLKEKEDIDLIFNTVPPVQGAADRQYIQVKQIIQRGTNKIGGVKPLLFDTRVVFGDEDALVFSYFGKLVPCNCQQTSNGLCCMWEKPNGELVYCDGPFKTPADCPKECKIKK